MPQPRSYALLILVFGVVLVVSAATAADRFIDNGDGTVTDRKSGLMWAKTDNQFDIFWKQAQVWSRNDFPGTVTRKYDDWRLPTIKELQSLYVESGNYRGYPTDCGFQVKAVPQIRLSCTLIWSSQTALGSPLAFNFFIGNAFTVDVHDNKGCRVLPVRNLK